MDVFCFLTPGWGPVLTRAKQEIQNDQVRVQRETGNKPNGYSKSGSVYLSYTVLVTSPL